MTLRVADDVRAHRLFEALELRVHRLVEVQAVVPAQVGQVGGHDHLVGGGEGAQPRRELLTYMAEDPRTITQGAHLLFIAKNIERIGDHATNIAEWIHFQVSGVWLSEPRPKGDTTSSERIAEAG